jgi:hypothetical protein
MSQPLMTDTNEKKIKRLAMLIRIAGQRIETSDEVTDTLWFDDHETVCDALYRAADELISIAESNTVDQPENLTKGKK